MGCSEPPHSLTSPTGSARVVAEDPGPLAVLAQERYGRKQQTPRPSQPEQAVDALNGGRQLSTDSRRGGHCTGGHRLMANLAQSGRPL